MKDLEFIRPYIDDLLCIKASTFEDHLARSGTVLKRIQQAGLKVNPKKYFFAPTELKYLGH